MLHLQWWPLKIINQSKIIPISCVETDDTLDFARKLIKYFKVDV